MRRCFSYSFSFTKTQLTLFLQQALFRHSIILRPKPLDYSTPHLHIVPSTFRYGFHSGDILPVSRVSLRYTESVTYRGFFFPHRTRLPYVGALTHRGQVSTLSFSKVEGKLWISKPGSYNVGDWRLDAVAASGLWQRSGSLRIVRVVGSSSLSI